MGDQEERHLSSVVNFVRWVQGQQHIDVGPTSKEEWDPVFLLSQTRRHVATWAQIMDRICVPRRSGISLGAPVALSLSGRSI
ncbi:hypothetical protein TorRG33x02_135500 [Trema orientale]|uniref:Uncharacterized protein n=1 Tax=Trema orientale TaxID=63057 RepID=A0A2P5EYT0_TREOI|nr:hypothetical protein TorRG33x02_135500 [Trema orientale]